MTEETPRGKRRKQPYPRRNHDVCHETLDELGSDEEDAQHKLAAEGSAIVSRHALVCRPMRSLGQNSLQYNSYQPEAPMQKETKDLTADIWAIKDSGSPKQGMNGNCAAETEQHLEKRRSRHPDSSPEVTDYAPHNGTYKIHHRTPEAMAVCRTPEPEGKDDGDGSADTSEAFAHLLTCSYCGRGYRRQSFLREHIKYRHEREGNFICPLCGYTVHYRGHLERHMAIHSQSSEHIQNQCSGYDHNGDNRKFKCFECGKAFKYKHHLKEHLRIHSGEKPYECPNCKKRFSHSGSYSSHLSNKKCLPAGFANGQTSCSTRAPSSVTTSMTPTNNSASVPHLREMPSAKETPLTTHEKSLDYIQKNKYTWPYAKMKNGDDLSLKNQNSAMFFQNHLKNFTKNSNVPLQHYYMLNKSPDNDLQHFTLRKQYYECLQNIKGKCLKENGLRAYIESKIKEMNVDELKVEPDLIDPSTSFSPYKYYEQMIPQHFDFHKWKEDLRKSLWTKQKLSPDHSNNYEKKKFDHSETCLNQHGRGATKQKELVNLPVRTVSVEQRITYEQTCSPKLKEKDQISFEKEHNKELLDPKYPAGDNQWPSNCSAKDTKCFLKNSVSALEKSVISSDCKSQNLEDILLSELYPSANSSCNHQSSSFFSPLSLSLPSPKSNPCTPNSSTSEDSQAEPLDLSLPKHAKGTNHMSSALSRISCMPQGHEKISEHFIPGRLTDHEAAFQFDSLQPNSVHTAFSPLNPIIPGAFMNFLHEGQPALHVNPGFSGFSFLAPLAYMYDMDSNFLHSSRHVDKLMTMGDICDRNKEEYPVLLDDAPDLDLGTCRKRLKKTEDGLYACDICDKTFQKSSSLLRHKYEHTGRRPHQCEICKKAFKHKHHLIEHSRLHSGEKPYQCDKCGKRFSHSGSYSQHMNHRYAYCRKDMDSSVEESHGEEAELEEFPLASDETGVYSSPSKHHDQSLEAEPASEDQVYACSERGVISPSCFPDYTKEALARLEETAN